MNDVKEVLGFYSSDIIQVIIDELSDINPKDLQDASIYLTKAGGKMLRPCLSLISSEAVGGKKEDAFHVGAAIELIHTFSLIHDDIMDNDDMRRGMPSVHMVWDDEMAILAGDTLLSKAFKLIGCSAKNGATPLQISKTLDTISDACIKICEGQALDISFEGRYDVSEEEYLEMIFKKTGALICAATKSGAIMGGADEDIIDIMYDYGRLIGLAFQIQDDYLDLVSDEESLGKPIGSDIVKGKMTLIVVNALEKANDEDRETLLKILKEPNSSDDDVDIAIEIFNKYGAIEYAHNIAQNNVDEAKQLLEILPDSSSKATLELIADFVLERHS